MRKKSLKEDILIGYAETLNDANEVIKSRKKFWFEIDSNDSD
jgi:hypothetical protein